jgi:small subunit ribosomal protein S11
MAEDKKDIKQEKIKDNKAAEKPAEVKVDLKTTSVFDEKKEKEFEDSLMGLNNDGPEELPEEVRKKLEQSKNEQKNTKGKGRKKKKKEKKNVSVGRAYVNATYNNTIVSLTDLKGEVISWASAGMAGFKGAKKSTPYAAQIIARIAVEKAKDSGLKEVSVYVNGVGTGRESAVRALNANGLNVSYIKDVTPIPHNGCRKRKPRRV